MDEPEHKIIMAGNQILRPSWDEYFMKAAFMTAERSSCIRHHVGAVAVRGKRILATGYNGAPARIKNCLELGCLRNELDIPSGEKHEICRAVHAEQNLIAQGATYVVSLEGSIIYCTHSPCNICAKMLAAVKIEEFVACYEYPDKMFIQLFQEAGIKYRTIAQPSLEIRVLK